MRIKFYYELIFLFLFFRILNDIIDFVMKHLEPEKVCLKVKLCKANNEDFDFEMSEWVEFVRPKWFNILMSPSLVLTTSLSYVFYYFQSYSSLSVIGSSRNKTMLKISNHCLFSYNILLIKEIQFIQKEIQLFILQINKDDTMK